ncbi:hypothetical protein [Paenibacillus sp. MMS18-CY102]|uniref:hypothetical protein n=1 Tax=Paenibacillus sp. MMS18-CY102 TaxID=2682849 RepID=UPI0013662692|nr:hypothetical protein [Paenibacillus sp. MMS18-CY102]MWC31362.1 hypothetical protein [Paenibacillus sp. MMS18-CY102]
MKGNYFHPHRITDGDSSLLMDSNKYAAVVYFLEQIEKLAPEAVSDLVLLHDTYSEADHWFRNNRIGSQEWPSEWSIVSQAETNHYSTYLKLKRSIEVWINKFKLKSKDDFYHKVALTALSFYYDDCKESNRIKRLAEYKVLAKRHKVSLEVLRNSERFSKEWPYNELLSLSRSVFFEDESDDIELNKSIGRTDGYRDNFFEYEYPFIFTPSSFSFLDEEEGSAGTFEWMSTFYSILNKKGNYDSNDKSHLTYFGTAWDPRKESWENFESKIDVLFKQYKELYRERSEAFLAERGYVKERTKRNLEHFKWLVHYQVQGWSLRKISDHYSEITGEVISEDTIFHGIKKTADLVLLEFIQKRTR